LPPLTDCHAHLADPVFDGDREQVLARAETEGVGAVVTVGETLAEARRILELAGRDPRLLPAAGLYPTHLDLEQASQVETLIRDNRDRLCAIGEVGLDFWKVKEEGQRDLQREIFTRFIELGKELDLPLNIHSRSAGKQVIAALLHADARKVQLHAFDAKPATALAAVEAGYYFSVPPSIVRSRQKQKLVRRLPLDCLLLETDSPVLSPVPGERNEPANVRVSLRSIAELKELDEKEVAEAVTRNTVRLYGTI
jgi:TatD DNase family protein